MKKFAICFITMLMLGGIFSLTMQNIDTPVIGAVVEIMGPDVAYADAYPCMAIPPAPPPPHQLTGYNGP